MVNVHWLRTLRGYCCPRCHPRHYRGQAVSMQGPRAENQDNYLLVQPDGKAEYLLAGQVQSRQLPGWNRQWWRLLVADGMGGHRNGREISEAAVQLAMELKPVWEAAALRRHVYALHQQLQTRFAHHQDRHSPGTTLVWVDVHVSGWAVVAYVGDSRLYHWSAARQTWQALTHDHTPEEFAWRAQESVAAEWQALPKQPLAQALGYGSYGVLATQEGHRPLQFSPQLRLDVAGELPPHARSHADVFAQALQAGDALLLASDGLWATPEQDSALHLPALAALASANAVDKLVWDVLAANGQDNTTVLLFNPLEP